MIKFLKGSQNIQMHVLTGIYSRNCSRNRKNRSSKTRKRMVQEKISKRLKISSRKAEQNDLKKARLQPNPEVIQRIRIWKIPNKLNRHKNQILKIRKFPKHSLINKNKKTPMRLQLQKKTISRRIRIQRSNRLLSNLVPFLN